jgi:molybdopterin converting factor small subunit
MKVLYFSNAASLAGCREEHWEIDSPISTEEFWTEALRRHPQLASIHIQSRLASGGEYVPQKGLLDPREEAAIIPPVSGG